MNSPAAHHTANAAAVVVPVTTLIAHAPEVVTVVLGLLGIVWYVMNIADWIAKKRASWTVTKTTTVTKTETLAQTPTAAPAPSKAT